MALPNTPDKGPQNSETAVTAAPAVTRAPERSTDLANILADVNKISERAAEGASENWSGGGNKGGAATGGQSNDAQMSPRDRAIANLPPPAKMQAQLAKHIGKEVRKLRREARRIIRIRTPGSAHELNKLYSRIRRLNALLSEILDASYEVLKRLFIRVFIDHQTLL